MRNKVKKGMMFLLLFVACFLVISCLSSFLVNLFWRKDGSTEQVGQWKPAVDALFAFIAANLFNVLGFIFERKKEGAADAPYILLKKLDETLVRKNANRSEMPGIVIGQGNYFVYVTVRLENTGQGAITACRIAGQRLQADRIEPKKSVDFRFQVCRKKEEDFLKSYQADFEFEDDRGRGYRLNTRLCVKGDANEPKFEIENRGKQRRHSV